jgi:hypothetical protein
MFCRVLCALSLAVPLCVATSGCDTRPKIVLPKGPVPPPPKPHAAGGGEPAQPAAPVEAPKKPEAEPSTPPAKPAPPNDMK